MTKVSLLLAGQRVVIKQWLGNGHKRAAWGLGEGTNKLKEGEVVMGQRRR